MSEIIGTATRVKFHDARRHFENGGTVLVSSDGHRETIPVTRMSTVHTLANTSWAELSEHVNTWRNRYPNQRYYTVELS
ncbi:serine phosphatase RsbU (regulator of sigma subunit) [Mycolicibacterium sp. BK634]|nr:serine phosphatase RsbU (regulator of sigma subunit) [Mycolicibacterium sp. BK634]